MQKTILLSLIVFIGAGCSPKQETHETIIDGNLLLNQNKSDYRSLYFEFEKTIDTVFNYPYSKQSYTSYIISKSDVEQNDFNKFVGNVLDVEHFINPTTELFESCLKNNTLKVKLIKFSNHSSYVFSSSPNEIKNCIVANSNKPMNEIAIHVMSNSHIYNSYKDNPYLRKRLDVFKSDGVITIKEFMDLTQMLIKLEDAERAVNYEKLIKNL